MPWLGLSGVHEKRGDLVGALEFARKARKRAPGEAMLALTGGPDRGPPWEPWIPPSPHSQTLAGSTLGIPPPTSSPRYCFETPTRESRRSPSWKRASRPRWRASLSARSSAFCFCRGRAPSRHRGRDRGMKIHPDSAPLQLARGLALAASPSTRAQAVESLSTALEGEVPDRGRVQLELGDDPARAGARTDAVIQLRGAAEAMPNMAEVHYRLGAALRASGDEPGARQALERFPGAEPGPGRKRRQQEEAAHAAERDPAPGHIRDCTSRPWTASMRRCCNTPTSRRPTACAPRSCSPRVERAGARLGSARARARRARRRLRLPRRHAADAFRPLSAAIAQLEKALTLDPSLGAAHGLLALIAMAEDRPEDAVGAFRRAIAAVTTAPRFTSGSPRSWPASAGPGRARRELAIARKQRQQQ